MALLKEAGVSHAALFGSVARGAGGVPGDIDILIWPRAELRPGVPEELAASLGARWGYPVNVAVYRTLDRATAHSALRDAIPLGDPAPDIAVHHRRIVEGYETDRQRQKRLANAKKEAERAQRDAFAQVPHAISAALARLRGSVPPDCMIEIWGDRLFRKNIVLRRCPGWVLGQIGSGTSNYGPTSEWFAVGEDGRLYIGGGVGERKEFRTHREVKAPWRALDVDGLLKRLDEIGR